MRDFDTIRQMALELQRQRTPIIEFMLEVQREYEADIVVPNPDVANEPDMPQLTPLLMMDVIDGLAQRAATVRPETTCPSLDRYKELGARSQERASTRERMISATYHHSGWMLGRRRAIRHVNAYETMALAVEPDFKAGMPKLRVRNPLEAFPEIRSIEDMRPPEYVAYITRFSGAHLRERFPSVRQENGGPISTEQQVERWDIVEWHDCEQITYGLLGPVHAEGDHIASGYVERFGGPWLPLGEPIINRAGICLAFCPQAVTLHRIGNRMNRLLENTRWQSKLMALEVVAQEKAVFPDMYAMSSTGRTPRLVEGGWQDGRTGNINLLEGADKIGLLNQTPDMGTRQLIDRMERNFRTSSGLTPQMSGESHGAALRTGRALGAMAEMSIDPRIQELHELDQVWMPHVNAAILSAYKGWWGSKKYEMFSGWPGDRSTVNFIPNRDVETTDNVVEYAIPGADLVQLTQVLGSMLGADTIATSTFQRMHPWIQNPHEEQTLINTEKLHRATLEGLQQQVVSGQMPIAVFGRIIKKFEGGSMSLTDAIIKVDEEVRAEQLAAEQEAAAQQQQGSGGMPMDLNAVMGLAAGPGAAAPGMPAGGMPMPQQMAPAMGPTEQMRQMMTAANPGV